MGNQDFTLKGFIHKLPHSETHSRGGDLKSTWVICEKDSLTDFRACAGGAEICRNFPWEQYTVRHHHFYSPSTLLAWCWQVPFLTLSIYLAITAHPTPVFHCGPTGAGGLTAPPQPKWLPPLPFISGI